MSAGQPTVSNLERYTLRTLPQNLSDPTTWPIYDQSHLDEGEADRCSRYMTAITGFMVHRNAQQAAAEAGVTRNTFLAQVDRCLTIVDETIAGWRALKKHSRIQPYVRQRPPVPTGGPGQFARFLEAHDKDIRQPLNQYILSTPTPNKPQATHRKRKQVFKVFKRLCKDAGIREDEYPLASASQGQRSVERYVQKLILHNANAAVGPWYGQTAATKMNLGTGDRSFQFATKGLARWAVDAHKIDCIATVEIMGPFGPQTVAITRLWIIAVVDVSLRGSAGYAVGIGEEVGAHDVRAALVSATSPWKPKSLTISGLRYGLGAGFLQHTLSELGFAQACPSILSFDNALAHYAKVIRERARRSMGVTVTYGPVGAWWFNAVQERLFRTFESLGIQRLTSSVGNGPADPLKPEDSVRNAIQHEVKFEQILEVVDVLFANLNATPTSALGSQSPLQKLRADVERGIIVPRPRLPVSAQNPPIGISVETKRVAGSLDKGVRPYVQIDKAHYTNRALAERFDLIGSLIPVHINEEDMRFAEAFDTSGESLGTLVAAGGYGVTRHTRAMRKAINKLLNDNRIHCDYGGDPVEIYHQHLQAQAAAFAEQHPKKINSAATKVAKSSQATGLPIIGTTLPPGKPMRPLPTPPPVDADWSRAW